MTTETVQDVLRDFDAMAAECGGLEAATIHAMTVRLSVAHAREIEANDAYIREADRRISVLASLLNQANVDRLREVEALRQRFEVVEADARRYRFLRDSFAWTLTSGEDGARLSVYMVGVSITAIGPGEDEFDAAIDAAIGAGRDNTRSDGNG